MTVSLQSLGIDQLSVTERLELIEQIWESIPVEVEVTDIPPSHLAELARRRQAALSSPGQGKPWREVLTSMERAL